MSWELRYTKQALKDSKKIAASGLKEKAQALLDLLKEDPYQNPPPYKNVSGIYPVRIREESRFNTG